MPSVSSSVRTVPLGGATLALTLLAACLPTGNPARTSGTGSDLRSWDLLAIYATAHAHVDGYCRLQPWPEGMPQPQAVASTAVTISGADLASYETNVDPTITRLNTLNAEAVTTGRPEAHEALEAFFMDMVDRQLFTRLAPYRPETWHGTQPDWLAGTDPMAEPAASAAILLIPASLAYEILEPRLDTAQLERARAWGHTVFLASNEVADDLSGGGAAERRAAKAAGFVAWGSAAGDEAAYTRGDALFRDGVDAIRADGSQSDTVNDDPDSGSRALLTENNIYAFLVIAAHLLDRNATEGYPYRGANGGTIEAGVAHLLGATFDPARRPPMSLDQYTTYARQVFGRTNNSLAYLEYLARDVRMTGARDLLARGRAVRGSQGFYAGTLGGYTSCLLSPD